MGREQEELVSPSKENVSPELGEASMNGDHGPEPKAPAAAAEEVLPEEIGTHEAQPSEVHAEPESADAPPAGENGEPPKKEAAKLTPEEQLQAEAERSKRKRMYFVRFPKPPEVMPAEVHALETEVEVYRQTVRAMTSTLDSLRIERDNIRSLRDGARQALNMCRDAVTAKERDLAPFRQASRARRESKDSFRAEFGDLEFRSTAELDEAVRAIDYSMSHESHAVAEEKRMIARRAKIEAQRPRVRAYEEQSAELTSTAKEPSLAHGDLKAMEAEMAALVQERKVQSAIWEEYKREAEQLDERFQAVLDDRKQKRAELEELQGRLGEAKGALKGKAGAFRANRKFSAEVRDAIRAGRHEGARALCAAQVEQALGQLESDEALRAEYEDLWSRQRTYPVWQYLAEAEEAEKAAHAAAAGGPQARARAWPPGAVLKRDEPPAAREESGKEKAQKIIQKALEEAAALFAAKQKAKEAEASAAASREGTQRGGEDGGEGGGDAAQREGGGEEEGTPLLPNGGVPELQKKEGPAQTLGAAQMAEQQAREASKARIAKKRPEKKMVVEIPAVVNDKTPFVPPAAYLKREEEESEEDARERARQRNAEAAAEAAARRDRRRRAAEKKAEQKSRAGRERAGAAVKAAPAGGGKEDEAAAAAAPAAAAEEEGTGGAEDGALVPAAEAAPSAADATAAAAVGPAKAGLSNRAPKKAAAAAPAPLPKPRLSNRKKALLARTLDACRQALKNRELRWFLAAIAVLAAIWLFGDFLPRRLAARA